MSKFLRGVTLQDRIRMRSVFTSGTLSQTTSQIKPYESAHSRHGEENSWHVRKIHLGETRSVQEVEDCRDHTVDNTWFMGGVLLAHKADTAAVKWSVRTSAIT